MSDVINLPYMKRGDLFEYVVSILKNGAPYDVNIDDLRSEVRTVAGKKLAECEKELLEVGQVRFYVENTENWPVGYVETDYELTIGDRKQSSPTYRREIRKDITRP